MTYFLSMHVQYELDETAFGSSFGDASVVVMANKYLMEWIKNKFFSLNVTQLIKHFYPHMYATPDALSNICQH